MTFTLDEFKKSLESSATLEAQSLKDELEDLQDKYDSEVSRLETQIEGLMSDCKALCSRCWILSRGTTCVFCELSEYRCEHTLSYEDKFKIIKEMRKSGDA